MRSGSAILVPIDFSERSAPAARYAKTLAPRFDAQIHLLHAIPDLDLGISGHMATELLQQQVARMSAELNHFLPDELPSPPVERRVVNGDPATVIVRCAHEGADLIVIPTHGYGPYRRFILGSTTAKVLHDADCPVWTGVHLESAPEAAAIIRNIVCAVDLGPQSVKTLSWAAALAAEFDAKLTLIHVALGTADAARRELEGLISSGRYSADLLVETGDPPGTICSAAGRLSADVLVIGRGSAAGVFGRLRANAYSIIRQSPCPVVSV